MIISRARSYVFVHVPKTGGTAMARALESEVADDDILLGDTDLARARRGRLAGLSARGRLWKHATLADIDGILTPEDLDRMLVFTLVRNPWDRMVSFYHWLRVQRFGHPAVARARALDFGAFLRDPATQAAFRANPVPAYLTDAQGLQRDALVLRQEHLEQDIAPLAAHLGFRPDLPRVNASDRPADWRGLYDTDTAAIVADLGKWEIARFGYRLDP